MTSEHYFSASPQSPLQESFHDVVLRGTPVTVTTASGTFSPGGVDRGTEVLLKYAPTPPEQGTFVDVGCGWGPLSLALALESPEATIYGIDINERARHSAHWNAENLGLRNITICHPDEVPADTSFDLIWSNPPVRVGKAELRAIVSRWLGRLTPAGEAWFVIAKKLGGDSLQEWINSGAAGSFHADRAETAKGFRVLQVTRV
jgi:16S rRNA (guanine1207-N2)-methyltransferase